MFVLGLAVGPAIGLAGGLIVLRSRGFDYRLAGLLLGLVLVLFLVVPVVDLELKLGLSAGILAGFLLSVTPFEVVETL